MSTPALKEIFDLPRIEHVARELTHVDPRVDQKQFIDLCAAHLSELSLMQRLRQMTASLYAVLPKEYDAAIPTLKALAPRINSKFVTLVLPDYVGQYGLQTFERAMDDLRFFTGFGTSEYGIRPFLREDSARALKIMTGWVTDPDEHVRRLASEGCRPRLPWSFHLADLQTDPEPVRPILDALKQDDSLYVRKSVANHLNDITKSHPEWVMSMLEIWPLEDPRCAWIVRHALRTLIKKGDVRALNIIGVGPNPAVTVSRFDVSANRLTLGEKLGINVTLTSTAPHPQKLEVDYVLHYVKQQGKVAEKVFKFKSLTLLPGESVKLARTQIIKDFSTRKHHAGRHDLELMINGARVARACFDLVT